MIPTESKRSRPDLALTTTKSLASVGQADRYSSSGWTIQTVGFRSTGGEQVERLRGGTTDERVSLE